MKKLLLASLMTVLLVACDDKPTNTNNTNTAVTTTETEKPSVPENISAPDLAEKLFKAKIAATADYYNDIAAYAGGIKHFSHKVLNYEKSQEQSTAKTQLSIELFRELGAKTTFDIKLNHIIKHDAATLAEGLAAKVQSNIIKPKETNAKGSEILDSLNLQTVFKKDESYVQTLSVPEYHQGDVNFKGLSAVMKSTIANSRKGFGNFMLDFKGFSTVKDSFSVEPITFNGYYQISGNFEMHSDAPFVIKSDKGNLSIAKMVSQGKGKLDEKYSFFVGNLTYDLEDIQYSSNRTPQPITFKNIHFASDTHVDSKENVAQQIEANIIPTAGLIKQLSNGLLDASALNTQISIHHFPVSLMKDYQKLMQKHEETLATKKEKEEGKQVHNEFNNAIGIMFDKAKAQGGQLKTSISLVNNGQDLHFDSDISLLPDSPVTFSDLNKLKSPKALLKLLNINANASIPAPLVEATGQQMMLAMFFKKQDGFYSTHITSKDGQLLVNGVPAPL